MSSELLVPILPKSGSLIVDDGSSLFDKKDPKVVVVKPEDPLPKEYNLAKEIRDMESEELNRTLVGLVEKGASAIPKVGGIVAPVLKKVLSNFVKPKQEDSAFLKESIAGINKKLDSLDAQGSKILESIMSSSALNEVQKTATSLNSIWKKMKGAEKNGLGQVFKDTIDAIDSGNSGVSSMLDVAHSRLVDKLPDLLDDKNKQINKPFLFYIQDHLDNRLKSVDGHYKYNLLDYESDVRAWSEYFTDIQLKGAALMIIYLQSRLAWYPESFKQNSILSRISDLVTETEERIQEYEKNLLYVLEYDSFKLLKETSQHDPKISYPRLLKIQSESESIYWKVDYERDFYYPSLITTNKIDGKNLFRTDSDHYWFNSTFSFALNTDGTWNLRGSAKKYSLDAKSMNTIARSDGEKEGYSSGHGLFDRNFASFKIIPRYSKPSEPYKATIVSINRDLDGKVAVWNVNLYNSLALYDYSFFSGDPIERLDWQVRNSHRAKGLERQSQIWINNLTQPGLTKIVLLLQDIRCTRPLMCWGEVFTNSLIWLPDQRSPIRIKGISVQGVRAVAKFRAYKLKPGHRYIKDHVEKLLYIDPATGGFHLKEEGATALEDIFVYIDNPSGIYQNIISSATRYTHDTEGDQPRSIIADPLCSKGVMNTFEESGRKCYQNDPDREHFGAHVRLTYNISGGSDCKGEFCIYPRWA